LSGKVRRAVETPGRLVAVFEEDTRREVLSGYVSPLDHTFYVTVEADDYQTLARALGPLVSIGTGRVIPVITLDQAFPIAESGGFRATK
jgi:hypothetical protein